MDNVVLVADIEGHTMKTYAYLRVSTDQQDTDNQRFGVQDYMDRNSITAEWTEDTASGRVSWRERGIGAIVAQMEKGDRIIVSEVSRLGRSVLDVLEICRDVEKIGGSIYVVKQGMQLIGNAHAKMQLTMLAMFAEFERDMISARTKEALARKKSEGVKLGRPEGEQEQLMLDPRKKEIQDLLKKGVSKRSIARIMDCSPQTLHTFLKKRDLSN